MTSPRFNQRRAEAQTEMEILDALPVALRQAVYNAELSVRASSVRDALLRGVSEEKIIETLKGSRKDG